MYANAGAATAVDPDPTGSYSSASLDGGGRGTVGKVVLAAWYNAKGQISPALQFPTTTTWSSSINVVV